MRLQALGGNSGFQRGIIDIGARQHKMHIRLLRMYLGCGLNKTKMVLCESKRASKPTKRCIHRQPHLPERCRRIGTKRRKSKPLGMTCNLSAA